MREDRSKASENRYLYHIPQMISTVDCIKNRVIIGGYGCERKDSGTLADFPEVGALGEAATKYWYTARPWSGDQRGGQAGLEGTMIKIFSSIKNWHMPVVPASSKYDLYGRRLLDADTDANVWLLAAEAVGDNARFIEECWREEVKTIGMQKVQGNARRHKGTDA